MAEIRSRSSSGAVRPSRSNSFVRMLELEKKSKDQASAAGANTPPNRARRSSAHPPLSHQTQMMKAVRRTSALPSLSLSIPPSPTQTVAASTDASVPRTPPAREDRTKIVTFSGPEAEAAVESSDESSICHSPSWEQYGRKKKKKLKKVDTDDSKTLKKKGNRLFRASHQDANGVKSMTAADRTRSAPELESYSKPDHDDNTATRLTLQQTMTDHQLVRVDMVHEKKPKSRSKGFLSGLRMQPGNIASIKKLTGHTGANLEEIPVTSNNYTTSSAPRSHWSGSDADSTYINPRRPPSVQSALPNAPRSSSSQEKRMSGSRGPVGLSHGRSRSLLSSTLNKLKGPSYLYYRPHEESQDAVAKRPSSSGTAEFARECSIDTPVASPLAELSNNTIISPIEHVQQSPDVVAYPAKPQRAATEPSPLAITRSRAVRLPRIELHDSGSDRETPRLRQSKGHRVQIDNPRHPNRDAVMAKVMAQERQSRSDYLSRQDSKQEQGQKHRMPAPGGKSRQRKERTFRDRAAVKAHSIEDLITFEPDIPATIQEALNPQRNTHSSGLGDEPSASPLAELQSPTDETSSSNERKTREPTGTLAHSIEPQHLKADHGTSERSSSTYDDPPLSPSSATTPSSSRPTSRKGASSYSLDSLQVSSGPQSTGTATTQEDSWSRTAMPINLEDEHTPTLPADALSKILGPELPFKAQSALELLAAAELQPAPLTLHPLHPGADAGTSSVSLPDSPPRDVAADEVLLPGQQQPEWKTSPHGSWQSQSSSALVATGAAYLQEARRTAPLLSSTSRAPRPLPPPYAHKTSSPSSSPSFSSSTSSSGSASRVVGVGAVVPAGAGAGAGIGARGLPAQEPEPIAKVLVECCSCRFLHDMPARAYECMARPDSVVEDRLLGVSAAISTTVRCPWCAHGMTTACCAGWAAVVYLKEKRKRGRRRERRGRGKRRENR
ncbi:hypothetical protein GGR56DRAFT_560047 [Xylariaceae sp. FL0804]|nr:hypothetical protein GGR56DRAFT_560047 [Xylariaceae sp. FL0804]